MEYTKTEMKRMDLVEGTLCLLFSVLNSFRTVLSGIYLKMNSLLTQKRESQERPLSTVTVLLGTIRDLISGRGERFILLQYV
jgi:hypothetical protein